MFASLTTKRDYSTEQRKHLAKTGAAMSDGSYPITDAHSLHSAIDLAGMGSDGKAAIKAHIRARAEALGLTSALPASWSAQKGDGAFVSRSSIAVNAPAKNKKSYGSVMKKPKNLPGGQVSPMNLAAVNAAMTAANS